MNSGGNMQYNEERSVEKSMDNYLKSIGLHRKKIAKDGSCLFRAVAEQVLHNQSLHTEVRAKCVEFLRKNRDSYEAFIEGDFEEYLFKLQDPQQWVGEVEINALAVMYKRDFLIFQEPDRPAVNITAKNFKDKVQLCFLNGNHYDSVYPISHIKNTAVCQSILYELLYDGVFNVDRGSLTPIHRSSRPNDHLSDDVLPVCGSSDESDPDTNEPLWVENGTSSTSSRHNNQSYRGRGRGRQLPERVRRSLNPTLLRNVEYDVWHKSKTAQQKLDYCIAAGMHFSVGDRCQVRMEQRSYNGVVKEEPHDNGMVMVHMEELGRKLVPLWNLRPPNDENSWSTVVSRDKRLSNGHGGSAHASIRITIQRPEGDASRSVFFSEWEERGRGRGRGKSVPASSSVSQATAAGSGGRVQKQHSWPQQGAAEEHGGGKTSRTSVSSAEAAFGITPESRKAKEEEELNMALVEIQLRDESSFPALGTQGLIQGEGGRKKGGEKRRSQRNKTKSPVDDVQASSHSTGERPKFSTAPPGTTSAPSSSTTTPTNPAAPAPPAGSDSARLSSVRASISNVNMVTAATGSAPSLPPASKASLPSYASAATPPSPPPPAAKPTPTSTSSFSFVTPVLPAASSPPASSSSPLASSSYPSPTFIAPIAPSPTAPKGVPRSFSPASSLPHSPSPPSSSPLPPPPPAAAANVNVQVIQTPPAQLTGSLPKPEGSLSASQASQIHPQVFGPPNLNQVPGPPNQNLNQVPGPPNQNQVSGPPNQNLNQVSGPPNQNLNQVSGPPNQNQVSVSLAEKEALPEIQTQTPRPQSPAMMPQMRAEVQPSIPHSELLSEEAPPPHIQPPHPSTLPHPYLSLSSLESSSSQSKTEAAPPQKLPSPPPPPTQQAQSPHPSHLPPAHPPPHHTNIPGAVPLQQLSQLYQDPLYPGFPQGEKGEMAPNPPFSFSKLGDDLPQDVNVLRFFFNLGVKVRQNMTRQNILVKN